MRSTGKVFIISGPSGSGKTTLYKQLLSSKQFKKRLVKTVSVTTRARRPGEKHGRDYIFVSQNQFLSKKRLGQFLESQKVFDHYYGTPKKNVREFINDGENVLLCIDVKGARVVRRHFPDAVTIFIKTPSLVILRKRLERRGSEGKKTIKLRLKIAHQELLEAKHYNYVIINDRLKTAFKDLKDVVSFELGALSKTLRKK